MTTSRSSLPTVLLGSALALVPALAQAHTGVPGHTHGEDFTGGMMHPLTGMDHLLAMLAIGLWAVQLGGRALWLVPMTFVGVTALGGVWGMGGATLPGMEMGILGSVFVLAALLIAAVRLPVVASVAVAGALALFHGYAHGAEMPAGANAVTYTVGFVLSTLALHAAGIAAGAGLRQAAARSLWLRAAGVAVLAGACVVALR